MWPELEIVAEARNGREAVRLFDERHPDICFLDVHMPDGGGVAVMDYELPDKAAGGKEDALQGFNLTIEPGEKVALVGKNGEGKSTFVKAIMGEIEYEVVRERKKLAYGGAISLVVPINRATHQLAGEPHITFQGVAGIDAANGFSAEAKQAVIDTISEMKREQIADRNVFDWLLWCGCLVSRRRCRTRLSGLYS